MAIWLFDHEILPCGYLLYRKDRATHGGGVLIALSDLVPSTLNSTPPDLEINKCLKTVHSFSDCLSLQNDLHNLIGWSQLWNLHFNDKKCALRFSAKCSQIPFNYTLNNKLIATTEHYRDLGVIMSHNLSWKEHLKYISFRAYKFLGLIRRSFSGGHQPGTLHITHSFTTHILFTDMETSLSKGYSYYWKNPTPCNQIYSQWFFIRLQISFSDSSNAPTYDAAWTEWYYVFL